MDTALPARRHLQDRSRSRVQSILSNDPQRELKRADYAIGICLLLVVVFLWTSSNFITQDMYEGGYDKPFLLTYLNTSSFSVYLLPFFLRRALNKWRDRKPKSSLEYQPISTGPDTAEEPSTAPRLRRIDSADSESLAPLTVRETAKLAAMFCIFWFIANWSVNASLNFTSVASATILSSLSGFFTLIIGRMFRVESLTLAKAGAVILSFCGSVLVTSSDSRSSQPAGGLLVNESNHASRPVLGDLLALLSALFYALYVILLKVRIREEARIDMQLFFGFVGLVNILCLWPIGFILHFAGMESFELPSSRQAVISILLNMGITLSSDFIYVLAMLKTTPLVVTIGLSLTIPLAVLGDFLLGRPAMGQVLLGAGLVLVSFIAVGLQGAETDPSDRRRRSSGHEPSVKLAKRQFAAQGAVEHVEVGALEDVSGTSILQSLDAPEEPRLKKKEKQQLKREAFIDKLQSARSPYSKTQNRRFKKKQREQVAGGLGEIQAAIIALDDEKPNSAEDDSSTIQTDPSQTNTKVKLGLIGEGKGQPLSKNQRKRALEMEQLRAPMIRANPEFASNPFKTIRTHAQNTLLKHENMSVIATGSV
ncbi:hypothetical protein HWV62_27907 [Athelia sp. TMB]|nr:hypothetical protein HWV62_27907 [Athelia sp. TMB]